jgi:hypothetical protein
MEAGPAARFDGESCGFARQNGMKSWLNEKVSGKPKGLTEEAHFRVVHSFDGRVI